MLLQIDLLGLEAKELLWYQMAIRTVLVSVVALGLIRLAGMRSFGTQSAFDVVLPIILGTLLGSAIIGRAPFFPCLAAAMLLALMHRGLALLSARYKTIDKITQGDAVLLYAGGNKIKKNMLHHGISDKDLGQALHQANLDDFEKVKTIWMEPDGKISIVKNQP